MTDPLSALSMALSSLKATGELAKTIFDAKVDAASQDKLIQMRGLIAESLSALIDAKTEVQAAQEAKREAISELMELKKWGADRERYQLFSPIHGAVLYALRSQAVSNGEPAHYLCASCYQLAKKSLLQNVVKPGVATVWRCHLCNAEIPSGSHGPVAAIFAPSDGVQ